MFIEQGLRNSNKFWKYIVGCCLVISASFLGQIPMLLLLIYETRFKGRPYPESESDLLHFFEPNLNLFLLLIPFVCALLALFSVVRSLHEQPALSIVTSRSKLDWNRVGFSFGIWSVFTLISTLIAIYWNPGDFTLNFQLVPFVILLVIASVMIPIQSSLEELLFRGYLMQGISNLFKNRGFSLLMTSLIFGMMHFFNPEVSKMGNIIMVYYIGTGLLLGIMTLMDEGTELALGFHAANNLIGALLVTSDWSAFQTYSIFKDVSNPEAGMDIIFPVFVIYPILLIIFGVKYSWKDWRVKLTANLS